MRVKPSQKIPRRIHFEAVRVPHPTGDLGIQGGSSSSHPFNSSRADPICVSFDVHERDSMKAAILQEVHFSPCPSPNSDICLLPKSLLGFHRINPPPTKLSLRPHFSFPT